MQPRPPTALEIDLLDMLLPDGAFPDVSAYQMQARNLFVTSRCDCGCPTVNFSVDEAVVPAATFHGDPLLPLEARAREGERSTELILFAPSGWLQSLELVYYTREPPTDFPERSEFHVVDRRTGQDDPQSPASWT